MPSCCTLTWEQPAVCVRVCPRFLVISWAVIILYLLLWQQVQLLLQHFHITEQTNIYSKYRLLCGRNKDYVMLILFVNIHQRSWLACFHRLIISRSKKWFICNKFNPVLNKKCNVKVQYWGLKSFSVDFPSSRHWLGSNKRSVYLHEIR